MDNVQFQEDTYIQKSSTVQNSKHSAESKSVNFLIEKEIVKDKKQANILLICCAIILLGIASFILLKDLEPAPVVIPYQDLSEEDKNKIPAEERSFIEANINSNQP